MEPKTTDGQTIPVQYNFMFLKSYKDSIDLLRDSGNAEAAGKLALAIFRYGVRREWTEDLPDAQRAFMRSIKPYIEGSCEKYKIAVKAQRRKMFQEAQKATPRIARRRQRTRLKAPEKDLYLYSYCNFYP